MSDQFNCPKCDQDFSISNLEMWDLYDDGKETEFDCTNCGCEMIINSLASGWTFETESND